MSSPLYEQIAVGIEAVATRIHTPWLTAPDGSRKEEELFNSWNALRSIAGRIRCTKSVYLTPGNWTQLYAGFLLAHDLEHNADLNGVPRLPKCDCSTASKVAEVIVMLAKYNAELQGESSNAAA
jgi:hypothetical protein